MTLATHAVVGAAAASFFPASPLLAAGAAFASHYLIDAIPHGHYRLFSLRHAERPLENDMQFGRLFIVDLLRTGADFTIGIALSLFLFSGSENGILIPLIGVVAGVLPDPLQFAYWKIRREPLTSLQRFHIWVHAKRDLSHRRAHTIGIEFAFIAASAAIAIVAS